MTSLSQLASSEARGIIRIIERMFPSTPANQEATPQIQRKVSSEKGNFQRVETSTHNDADDENEMGSGEGDDGEEYDVDNSAADEKENLETKQKIDLEISHLEDEAEKNRRSALVIALLSEKKTMRLGLQVFNQSCSKCHGTFQYSKPHLSRSAYRRAKRKAGRKSKRKFNASSIRIKNPNPKVKDITPVVDLQTILYKFGKSETIIEKHLTEGLDIMPSHRFENLTNEELRAVTRFVMSIN